VEENSSFLSPKELISPAHQASFMAEERIETTIHEYGSDVITGMPDGQKIKWKDTTYSRIQVVYLHRVVEHEKRSTRLCLP
jgi:hypothetical protein